MKSNTIIIDNKEFILPDSVLLIFNEYLDKYFREKKLNELSNLKNSLMNEYKETSAIHFKKKTELKKKISDLTTEMMKFGVANSKIEIPDWQTIEDPSLKYQFLYNPKTLFPIHPIPATLFQALFHKTSA